MIIFPFGTGLEAPWARLVLFVPVDSFGFVPGQKPGSQQVFRTIPIPSLDKGTAD